MYRLNVNITEEAAEFLKKKAQRYGTTMGAIITMTMLNMKREDDALDTMAIYKAEQDKQSHTGAGNSSDKV